MRIIDWSSDVCSSDLSSEAEAVLWTTSEVKSSDAKTLKSNARSRFADAPSVEVAIVSMPFRRTRVNCAPSPRTVREEARRVGKGCVSRCRCRCSPYHYKKQRKQNIGERNNKTQ